MDPNSRAAQVHERRVEVLRNVTAVRGERYRSLLCYANIIRQLTRALPVLGLPRSSEELTVRALLEMFGELAAAWELDLEDPQEREAFFRTMRLLEPDPSDAHP